MLHTWIQLFGGADDFLSAVFVCVFFIAFVIDFFLLSAEPREVSNKQAVLQTAAFVSMAVLYGVLMYYTYSVEGQIAASRNTVLEYFSAYIMEYSLSTDNLFVFILILAFFKVKEAYYGKVLFWGVLFAILFRLAFIYAGIFIIARFNWVLYIFGAILIYTGYRMMVSDGESEVNPETNFMYRFLKKHFRFTHEDAHGRFVIRKDDKTHFTMLMMVVVILAGTDLVFALDSIPAVFAISTHKLVIITSNIFAVLGLRSLFFLLRNAVNQFVYLPKAIAIILLFIGVKMLLGIVNIHIDTSVSLIVIIGLLAAGIGLSMLKVKKPV